MIIALASSTDPHVAALVTLLSAALIFTLATSANGKPFDVLSWRLLALLGAASYSLYLLSSPMHHLLEWFFPSQKLMLLLQYSLIIVAALVVFRFYEEPVREALRTHWKMRRSAIARI